MRDSLTERDRERGTYRGRHKDRVRPKNGRKEWKREKDRYVRKNFFRRQKHLEIDEDCVHYERSRKSA